MQGIERRSFFLAREVAASPMVMGPWEYSMPGIALFLENMSDEIVEFYVAGGETRSGTFTTFSGFPVTLNPKGREIVLLGSGGYEAEGVSKFLAFFLDAAVEVGIKVNMIGFSPLPECQMATPAVGSLDVWWD